MKRLIATIGEQLLVPAPVSAQNADLRREDSGISLFPDRVEYQIRCKSGLLRSGPFPPPGEPLPADFYINDVGGGVNTGFDGEMFVSKGLGLGAPKLAIDLCISNVLIRD